MSERYFFLDSVSNAGFLKQVSDEASSQITSGESVNIAECFVEHDTSETDKNGDISTTSKRSRDSVWKGQYCCVPLCRNASGGSAERRQLGSVRVSFHSFPNLSTDKRNGLLRYVEILDQTS